MTHFKEVLTFLPLLIIVIAAIVVRVKVIQRNQEPVEEQK